MNMRTHLLAAILVITIATVAYGQEAPASTVQRNTIYVGTEGRYEATPDTALIQFNIAAQQENAKDAYQQASKAAEQIRQVLRNNDIDPKAAEIGFYSLTPVYDWKSAKRKLVGYRVNTSVSLKLKDFSKVAAVLQQLVDVDMTENQSLSYTLENIDAAKVKAMEDGYRRAHAEAAALALTAGRTLGELVYGSVDTYEQIRPMAVSMAPRAMTAQVAAPTAEFSPQRIVVTARVNTMFALK